MKAKYTKLVSCFSFYYKIIFHIITVYDAITNSLPGSRERDCLRKFIIVFLDKADWDKIKMLYAVKMFLILAIKFISVLLIVLFLEVSALAVNSRLEIQR